MPNKNAILSGLKSKASHILVYFSDNFQTIQPFIRRKQNHFPQLKLPNKKNSMHILFREGLYSHFSLAKKEK